VARIWENVRSPGVPPPGVAAFSIVLLAVTGALVAVLLWLGVRQRGIASWHFHEGHPGTYYSGLLLVAAGALAFAVARKATREMARFWRVAAIGFLFLSLDELTLVHEGVDKWIHVRLGWPDDDPITDHIDDVILLLYGAVALVWAFRYRATLLRMRWATLLLVAAFVVFLVMALLDITDFSKAAEETLKVFSEALIVSGLFAALQDPALADPS
jgi:hypothetical protein